MDYKLGNLEEAILLLIMILREQAYGFSVSQAYKEHFKKGISISAVHAVMSRLEKKGFVHSTMMGATEERGGRRKRIFRITQTGIDAVNQLKLERQKLWGLIPELNAN